jgi:hypothetical protein
MALEDYALTSLEKARLQVLGDADDTAQDERLTDLVNAFSLSVINYVRRQFQPTEDGATKRFSYSGKGVIDLTVIDDQPYELRAVTAITLYSDMPASYQVVLSNGDASNEADYRLNPRNKTREGTYTWLLLPTQLSLPPVASTSPTRLGPELKEYEISITGDWGAGVVPSIVEKVVLRELANDFRNPEGFQNRSLGEFAVTEMIDGGGSGYAPLSWGSKRLLEPYRRPVIGG